MLSWRKRDTFWTFHSPTERNLNRFSDSTIKKVNIEGNSSTTLQHEKASVSLIILTLHLPTACHEFISLVVFAMLCPSEEKT